MTRLIPLVLLASTAWAQPVIGPGVAETLSREGTVRVVVALDDGIGERHRGTVSVDQLRASVALVQRRLLAALPSDDVAVTTRFEAVPALVMRVSTQAALEALGSHPTVLRVDLDEGGGGGGRAGGLGTSVSLIQASDWHRLGVTGDGVVVAVLDTGVDTDHADFAGAIVDQSCFLDFDGRVDGLGRCPNGGDRQMGVGAAEDDHGHGTNVTGILASRGAVSAVGVAPGVQVAAVKVLDRGNSFNAFSEIVAALDYLIARPELNVQVVNMSLGTFSLFPGVCDQSASWTVAGSSAARTLRQRGVSLYASSSNEGSATSVSAPACLSDVVAVAASTLSDQIGYLSNTGPQVQIVAPGLAITASGLGGGTSTYNGTSQASPHVAGCAALLLAADVASTPDELEVSFENTATVTITDLDNGRAFPRLDCYDASFSTASEDDRPLGPLELSAPYPNPARGLARVRLRADRAETIRVVLSDALGRLVSTVYDGTVPPGSRVLTVDAGALAPGIYSIRAVGPSSEAVRPIVVVR